MSNKTFHTISRKECLNVYKDILHNSDKKWIAAKKLATIEEYGGAISFLIISIEEMVKALIIAMDGNGFNFRSVKGVDRFFRDHEIRYAIAFFMFVLSFAGNELKELFIKIENKEIDMQELGEEISSDTKAFLKKKKTWFLRKYILLYKELNWFSNINKLRQDGIYCGYNNSLSTPMQITHNNFINTYKRLEGVREVGKGMIDFFACDFSSHEKAMWMHEILTNFRNDFKRYGFYAGISDLLSSLGNEAPLESLKNRLQKTKETKNLLVIFN